MLLDALELERAPADVGRQERWHRRGGSRQSEGSFLSSGGQTWTTILCLALRSDEFFRRLPRDPPSSQRLVHVLRARPRSLQVGWRALASHCRVPLVRA